MTVETELILSYIRTKKIVEDQGLKLDFSLLSWYIVSESGTNHFSTLKEVEAFIQGVEYQKSLLNTEVAPQEEQKEAATKE